MTKSTNVRKTHFNNTKIKFPKALILLKIASNNNIFQNIANHEYFKSLDQLVHVITIRHSKGNSEIFDDKQIAKI